MEYFLSSLFLLCASFFKCIVDNKIDKKFFQRRSSCVSCSKELLAVDLIPFFSYIFLKGRCRFCKKQIPKNIFYYEVSSLLVALCYLFTHKNLFFIGYLDFWIVLLLIFISIEDVSSYEINPKLQLIIFVFAILKLASIFELHYLKSTLILILGYHALYIFLKKGIGYGDIKLWSILSFTLDLIEGINLFLFTFIFGGFFAIYLLLTKKATAKKQIPLAPFITLAYITILVFRELIIW